jgi:hypothetical protein
MKILDVAIAWLATIMIVLCAAAALAQEADEDDSDEVEEIEEIIVSARKPGDRRRVDQEYEDPLRARILRELHKLDVLEEEYEWRAEVEKPSASRISWGYDPREDYRMRNEMDLREVPWENSKPATIFSIDF